MKIYNNDTPSRIDCLGHLMTQVLRQWSSNVTSTNDNVSLSDDRLNGYSGSSANKRKACNSLCFIH